MKGHEIIALIQKNKLEDFDVEISFTDGHNIFPNVRTFSVSGIADIGHSDKKLLLDVEEQIK